MAAQSRSVSLIFSSRHSCKIRKRNFIPEDNRAIIHPMPVGNRMTRPILNIGPSRIIVPIKIGRKPTILNINTIWLIFFNLDQIILLSMLFKYLASFSSSLSVISSKVFPKNHQGRRPLGSIDILDDLTSCSEPKLIHDFWGEGEW